MPHHPPPARARRPRRAIGDATIEIADGPVARPRPRSVALGLLLALVLVAAGCSGSEPTADDLADPGADGRSDDAVTDPDQLALTLGDPEEAGFEPVEADDVEPAEPPEAGTVDLVVDEPEAVIDDIDGRLDEPSGQGGEVLDGIEPIDTADVPAEPADDGRTRNEVGELVTLDDPANLACAQIEIAIGHLDEGLPAAATERVLSGAEWAGESGVADVQSWAEPLAAAVADGSLTDATPLVAFLSVCTIGGYEL